MSSNTQSGKELSGGPSIIEYSMGLEVKEMRVCLHFWVFFFFAAEMRLLKTAPLNVMC